MPFLTARSACRFTIRTSASELFAFLTATQAQRVARAQRGVQAQAVARTFLSVSLFILSALPVLAAESQTAATVDRPNVVLIMTDNHGAWTLGCYGNEEIRTPNIDRLATEGTLFDNAFASNPVCSPTRATTLTGLIPSQHGVHCFLRGGRLQTGPEARNTLAEFTSIPEVLKQNGYRCGLVGKWHLGANMSPQESFDDYWITMPHGGTSTFYDAQIIEDGKLRTEPEYLTDFWTKHAVRFIEGKNQTDAVASLPLDSDTSLAAASCESDDASSCDSAPDGATDCSRGRQPTATTFNPTPQARIHQPAPPRLRHRVKQPENASRLKQQVAQTFVSVNDKQPFFLFLAYNGPYSLSRLLLREGRNRHADFYRDQPLLSFPREKAHPWQLHNLDFHNNPVSIRRVATEVSGVDDGVGTVMAALKENGLDDNTIVIFMADQGWVGGHGGFFGMGDHTRPVTARDGMMKIPLIWHFPKKFAAGRRSEKLVANYDIMPTLLDVLGLEMPNKPGEPKSPGKSFAGELGIVTDVAKTSFNPMPQARLIEDQDRLADGVGLNDSTAEPDSNDAIFYEFEALRCVRTHDWKYVHRHPNGPHELYDLKNDPDEFNNLYQANQPNAPHDGDFVQQQLHDRLNAFFAEYASPKYDLYNGGGAQSFIYDGVEEEIAQAAPVEPPALPEGYTPQQFTLPDGFRAELTAGPPLVNHPTMGCFDDQGRLFICDGDGVNMSAAELEEKLPNHIKMLEDTDGDGRFDKSTMFADRMTFPMGGAWHGGALYVASPPNIWRLEDTDGDGVADKRDILVDKFGYTGNAASIHGCFLHPSGRIYWCDGYHGHEIKDAAGNLTSQKKGSYIFSCRPDGSDIQIHCGGGMDNPVEVDFTDEGDVIGTVNILYTRPRIDCLVHWQYGGAYPHREAFLEEWPVTGELLEPIHRFGHVAISGTMRYRSGVMNHNWRDNFFATQFNLGKVVRLELERRGSTYSVTERQFLSCDNRDFHPTDVIEDADGSLLVVDTGGWFYRGCPTSQIAKPDILGGIYRIRRNGMTTVPDPRGKQIDWANRSETQLMQDLKDTRYAVREQAIQECVRRGDAIAARLVSAVKSADIVARRNALWALARIPSAESQTVEAVRLALEDRDPGMRQAACHVAGMNVSTEVTDKLVRCLADNEPSVVREALAALGRMKNAKVIPDLLKYLGSQHREISHAASWALVQFGDKLRIPFQRIDRDDHATLLTAQLVQLEAAPSASRVLPTFPTSWPHEPRLQRLLINNYAAVQKQLSTLNADEQKHFNAVLGNAFTSLTSLLQHEQATDDIFDDFLTRFVSVEFVRQQIGTILSDNNQPRSLRSKILTTAARAKMELQPEWVASLLADLDATDIVVRREALATIAAIPSAIFQPQLTEIAASPTRPPGDRLTAIEGLMNLQRSLSADSFALLVDQAQRGGPGEAVRASRLLSSASLTAEQLINVAPILPVAGPQQLNDLVLLFKRRLTPEQASAFLTGLENARSLNSLPMIEVSEVVKSFPVELHDRANSLLDRMKAAEQEKLLKLDAVVELLKGGNAAAGREVFFSEKAKCATCHVVGSKENGELLGKRVGPDLTTIGANRSSKDLLESILFPSATIVRQYEPYTLVTNDGRSYSGLVIKDTSEEITIQQSTGDPITVLRSDIEELVPSTVSIMPKGLDEQLTSQQIADLVSWLQSLKK